MALQLRSDRARRRRRRKLTVNIVRKRRRVSARPDYGCNKPDRLESWVREDVRRGRAPRRRLANCGRFPWVGSSLFSNRTIARHIRYWRGLCSLYCPRTIHTRPFRRRCHRGYRLPQATQVCGIARGSVELGLSRFWASSQRGQSADLAEFPREERNHEARFAEIGDAEHQGAGFFGRHRRGGYWRCGETTGRGQCIKSRLKDREQILGADRVEKNDHRAPYFRIRSSSRVRSTSSSLIGRDMPSALARQTRQLEPVQRRSGRNAEHALEHFGDGNLAGLGKPPRSCEQFVVNFNGYRRHGNELYHAGPSHVPPLESSDKPPPSEVPP